MITTQFITTIAATSLLMISSGLAGATTEKKEKNLVYSGDFSKSKLETWLVGVTQNYSKELDFKVTQKPFTFRKSQQLILNI